MSARPFYLCDWIYFFMYSEYNWVFSFKCFPVEQLFYIHVVCTRAQHCGSVVRRKDASTLLGFLQLPQFTCRSSNWCMLGWLETTDYLWMWASECVPMSVHLWTGNLSKVFSSLLYDLCRDRLQHLVTLSGNKRMRQLGEWEKKRQRRICVFVKLTIQSFSFRGW